MLCNEHFFVRKKLSIKAGLQSISALKMKYLFLVILMVRLNLPVLPELGALLSNLSLQKTQGLAEGRGSFYIFFLIMIFYLIFFFFQEIYLPC